MTALAIPDYVLATEGLSKEFGGFRAVQNVNLKVRRGSIHALIGPNGAGKSTVFNLLTKFLEPTTGRIVFKGIDITHASPQVLARRGLVRSFQISAVFASMSVRDNVRIALQRSTCLTYRFWTSNQVLRRLDEKVDCLLSDVDLQAQADLAAGQIAYGRKRALELATTLALDPEVLLLDEPMAGLGTEDIDRIARLIKKVSANRTVLMVEHNLAVVRDLSDVITVLTRGQVLVEGSYSEISNHPDVVQAYLGTDHG